MALGTTYPQDYLPSQASLLLVNRGCRMEEGRGATGHRRHFGGNQILTSTRPDARLQAQPDLIIEFDDTRHCERDGETKVHSLV